MTYTYNLLHKILKKVNGKNSKIYIFINFHLKIISNIEI